MRMQCPSCSSTDIEWHEAGGDAVCVSCGTVCEESTIVSSIEFSEAGGSASVVGKRRARSKPCYCAHRDNVPIV